jgi:hypothetical protein
VHEVGEDGWLGCLTLDFDCAITQGDRIKGCGENCILCAEE